jgi:hypothetical protein
MTTTILVMPVNAREAVTLGYIGSWPSVDGDIIAFHTSENEHTGDLNGDGIVSKVDYISYYDISTGTGVYTTVFGRWLRIGGDLITFWVNERSVGKDLNGNGNIGDHVIGYYDISTGKATYPEGLLGSYPSFDGDTIVFKNSGITGFGNLVYHSISTGVTGSFDPSGASWYDVDGDFIVYNERGYLKLFVISTGTIIDTGVEGGEPMIDGNIISYLTGNNNLLAYYDISTGTVVNTGLSAHMLPNVDGNIISFTTYEGGVDLNGDGDTNDRILRYYDISTDTVYNTGALGNAAASTSGNIIGFWFRESSTKKDINNDGDTKDVLIRYYVIPGMAPEDKIEDLINEITDMDLPHGIENSLLVKLENALKSLEKGNDNAAVNQLLAFINEVEAKRGNELTEEQADSLITIAQVILDILS